MFAGAAVVIVNVIIIIIIVIIWLLFKEDWSLSSHFLFIILLKTFKLYVTH